MLSLLHMIYSRSGVSSSFVLVSCHDHCSTPQLSPFRAGEESTSLLAHDGYHFAALRGTATRRDSVAEPDTAAATAQVSAVPAHAGIAGDSVEEVPVAALAERVGDFNVSMDPWERTGAAPQGWASHLHQTMIPVQGYVQLRPHDTTLPSFGGCPPATSGTENKTTPTDVAIMGGGGKASPSVSIFSRAPLCPNTCRHCRSKPCDIATDHDDHICYNCEQRLLFPERIPKWETQNLPICDLWCQECAIQRCCTRGSHQYHLCMQCERRGVVFLAPLGGEDPWAANDD